MSIFSAGLQAFYVWDHGLFGDGFERWQWLIWGVIYGQVLTSGIAVLLAISMPFIKIRVEAFFISFFALIASLGNSILLYVIGRKGDEEFILSFIVVSVIFLSLFCWYFSFGRGTYSMLWRFENDKNKVNFDTNAYYIYAPTMNQLGPDSFWSTPLAKKIDVAMFLVLLLALIYSKNSQSHFSENYVFPAIMAFVFSISYMFAFMLPKVLIFFRYKAKQGCPVYIKE